MYNFLIIPSITFLSVYIMANSNLYNTLFSKNNMSGGAKAMDMKMFLQLVNEKRSLFIAIFANLFVQLCITYYIMMNYNNDKKSLSLVKTILLYLSLFVLIFLLAMPMPAWVKISLFTLFSTIFGYLLSTLKQKYGTELMQTAVVGTMGIFGVMLVAGAALLMMGVNLGMHFGLGLFFTLLFLIIARIITMLMGKYSIYHRAFAFIGLGLFSIYILYDTNHILQRNYQGDFITASLDYYLDIINLLVNVLGINDTYA